MAIHDLVPTDGDRLELSREILRLELASFERRILEAFTSTFARKGEVEALDARIEDLEGRVQRLESQAA